MILLHKYLKLVRAYVTPGDVIYCNRKPVADLTREDLGSYITDLIHIYDEHAAPYGPMIKLSTKAAVEHSALLRLAEQFIVCHELGHYFNGDLNDASAYAALPHSAAGGRYEENRDHEIEHRADIVGFGFYRRNLISNGLDPLSLEPLKPILAVFNLFYAMSGGASSTHPHPYDRVARIVKHWYGEDQGRRMTEALADPALLPALFGSHGDRSANPSTRV